MCCFEKHLEMDIAHAGWMVRGSILKTPLRASNRKETLVGRPDYPDAKVACDHLLDDQENLDNMDDTNIQIESYQNIRENELNDDSNEV